MIFIYEFLIFGGILLVIVVAYILSLDFHLRRDQSYLNRENQENQDQVNSASASSTDSLLPSVATV